MARLEAANRALRGQVQELTRTVASLQMGRDVPRVYADPLAQLRWEVEQAWLTGTPESERGEWLRWDASSDFLADLSAMPRLRGKVVEVMVDVVSDTVWHRRPIHQYRLRSRGADTLVRDDGAIMWRVYVKREMPSAPRLHFWRTPDRRIEFAHVGVHDARPPRK